MSDTSDPIQELIAAQRGIIANLTQQLALKDELLGIHESDAAWRSAIRSGRATVDDLTKALEQAESEEGSDALPPGFVRGPNGRVLKAGEDGQPQPPEPTPPAAGLDLSATFLGSIGRR
ncbi:MAG: hypothetical protein AAGB48_10615 [Planctomycetota bacterium]